MRTIKGSGMSNQEVMAFVTWYYKIMHPYIYVIKIE